MPSRVRLDHISGPDLDALMRDVTSDPVPTWRPARGIGRVFAAPSGRASAGVVMVALAVLLLVVGLRAVQGRSVADVSARLGFTPDESPGPVGIYPPPVAPVPFESHPHLEQILRIQQDIS